MRVTVTGATGHIGNNLVAALLEQGHEVLATARKPSEALRDLDVRFEAADVRDPEAVRRVVRGAERVYHCAALISLFDADEAQMREINVEGVRNMLAACEAEGVGRLVHFSSIHAFAPREGTTDESGPLAHAPHLPSYDRAKAAATELARAAAQRLDLVVVHPTGVLGPRDFLPSHLGRQLALAGRGWMKIGVEGSFDWVDVRDVVAGAIAAGDRGRRGQSYLLTGHRASASELLATAARVGGAGGPWFALPQAVLRPFARICDGLAWLTPLRPAFNSASLHALRTHTDVSRARAETELGYRPRPFEDSLTDTLRWFEEHAA